MSAWTKKSRMVRILYLLLLLCLSIRAVVASFQPGLDPWHMHTVLGSHRPMVQQAALLAHDHHGDHAHSPTPDLGLKPIGQPIVLSLRDQIRAILSVLNGHASVALQFPKLWAPTGVVSLMLSIWAFSSLAGGLIGPRPPTPPPRPAG